MLRTLPFLLLPPVSADEPVLKVDPLLLAEAAQVWQVLATDDSPVWPGWNVDSTPLLFYFPKLQDVLVNHPSPPAGFRRYDGEPHFAGFEVFVRDGKTQIELDGQNTSTDVAGVQTLVLADTLSNKRNNLSALLASARAGADVDLEYSNLSTDPYSQMAMIAHEAFHVFQHKGSSRKGVSELLLNEYPVLSVVNNVGVALEAEALHRALGATSADAARRPALAFLAARERRRATLPPSSVSYEDGTEWNEGLAKYVEWAFLHALEGEEPVEALHFAAGFHGLEDLRVQRESLRDSMRAFLAGDIAVNGDPYGTAPVRFRLYYSGMGLGAVLDRLGADWKELVMDPGVSLTDLLADALHASDAEKAAALEELERDVDIGALTARKQKLEKEGLAENLALADGILSGSGTTLVFDHSKLAIPGVGLAYTPFGVRRVDADRIVYTQIPIRVEFGGHGTLAPDRAFPLLQTRSKSQLALRLDTELDEEALLDLLGWLDYDVPAGAVELELPHLTVNLPKAKVSWPDSRTVLFSLER